MANWELTPGLQNLRKQINAAFPARDKTSDGTIGDAAHQAESASGHNPDSTKGSRPEWQDDDANADVRAWDMDSDLRFPGVSAQDVVDHLGELPGLSSVIRYMIFNRKIYRASAGFAPAAYTGASAHTEHIHFSGAYTEAADRNTTFDFRFEELTNMPLSDTDIAKIAAASRDALLAAEVEDYADPATPNRKLTLRTWFGYFEGREITTRSVIIAAINAAAAGDDVDEAQIIAGILAGLTPERIAAAIPTGLAAGVVNELRDRLADTGTNS
jgi:hypothetical protein